MSQSTLISPPSPTVALYNDRPATTSREVAKFFGKRHDNIVRDIRSLISNTPETFHALNFEEMSEDVEIGNGAIRQDPVFLLFRDGFMLLVMGYTGKKAMAIKIAYIEAFNALEAQVKAMQQQPTLPPAPAQLTKSTADDRKPLRLMVNAWAKTVNVHQTTLWPQVRAHFNLPRIDKLPVEWIPDAIAWVEGKISEGMQVHIQNQQKSSPEVSLPSAPAPSTSLTLESINERIDDLRVRTKAERLEILHDIMTCAFKMPGMGMLILDLQVAVEAMLENITGSGTESSFKYENPCTFIQSICNVISNSGQIERWRA